MVINEISRKNNKSNVRSDTTKKPDDMSKKQSQQQQQQQQQRKINKPFIITEKLSKENKTMLQDETTTHLSVPQQESEFFNESDSEPIDNGLNEEDIEFITANTEFTSEQIQSWHEDFLSKCTNGVISKSQFCTYYKTLMPSNLNDKSKKNLANKLFHLFDIDGDNSLNYAEFLVSFWIRCQAPLKEKFLWLFNAYDLDKNGVLDYNEIKSALTCCLDIDTMDQLLEQLSDDNCINTNFQLLQTSFSSPTIAPFPPLCYTPPVGSLTTSSTPIMMTQQARLPLIAFMPTSLANIGNSKIISISSSTSSATDDDDEAFYDDTSAFSSKSNFNSSFTDPNQQQKLELFRQQQLLNNYFMQQQQQQQQQQQHQQQLINSPQQHLHHQHHYNIYSRITKLVDDKLHELIIQLDRVSKQINAAAADNESLSTPITNSPTPSISSSNTNIDQQAPNNIKIQISRKSFINLCVKYKLLRKLLVPIDYYYEEFDL